jgi:hypothetical protein
MSKKNKIIASILIIITISLFFAFYRNNLPSKCYQLNSDAVGCFTIFQKGYWIKPTPRIISHSTSNIVNAKNMFKDNIFTLSLVGIILVVFYVYKKKHAKK